MVFHNFGSKFNRQQNGHHWNAPFMLITMVQIPASYLIPSPRYLAYCSAITAVSSSPLCREEILLTSEPLIDGSSEVLDVVIRSSCLLTDSSSICMVGAWPLTWREGEDPVNQLASSIFKIIVTLNLSTQVTQEFQCAKHLV